MTIEIREEPVTGTTLTEYASVSIAFEVRTVLAFEDAGLGGIALVERPVETPWTKDYDAYSREEPPRWADR